MSAKDISHLGASSNILLEGRKLRSQKPEVYYKPPYEGKSPVRRDSRPDSEDYTGVQQLYSPPWQGADAYLRARLPSSPEEGDIDTTPESQEDSEVFWNRNTQPDLRNLYIQNTNGTVRRTGDAENTLNLNVEAHNASAQVARDNVAEAVLVERLQERTDLRQAEVEIVRDEPVENVELNIQNVAQQGVDQALNPVKNSSWTSP